MQAANQYNSGMNLISETIVSAWQFFQNKNDNMAISVIMECQQQFPDSQDLQETLTRLFQSIHKREDDALLAVALEDSKEKETMVRVAPPAAAAVVKETEEKKEQAVVEIKASEPPRLILKLKRPKRAEASEMPPRQVAPTTSEEEKSDRAKKRKKVADAVDGVWCRECEVRSTPQWRRGPEGPGTLCNACGLRFAGNKKPSSKKEKEASDASSIASLEVASRDAPSLDFLAELAVAASLDNARPVPPPDPLAALRAQPVPVRKSAKEASSALQNYYKDEKEQVAKAVEDSSSDSDDARSYSKVSDNEDSVSST